MAAQLIIDEEWETSSVWIRFNLSEPIDEAGRVGFEQTVTTWMWSGVTGEDDPIWLHIDSEFEWYEGELGTWAECWLDLRMVTEVDPTPALNALLEAVSAFNQVASIQVGSDYRDWPLPPAEH